MSNSLIDRTIGFQLGSVEETEIAFERPLGSGLYSYARRENPTVADCESILAKTEAIAAGFDEAILLNQDGSVSEGSGENLFMIRDGVISTPGETDNCLLGITRDSIIQLAKDQLGMDVVQRHIHRSELYLSDEVFLTGTAAHVTAVGELDNRAIGTGETGPITKKLQDLYFSTVVGDNDNYTDWCTMVTPNGG